MKKKLLFSMGCLFLLSFMVFNMQMTFDKGKIKDTSLSASFKSALACGEQDPDLCDSQTCYQHLCGEADPCTTECNWGGMTGPPCTKYNTCSYCW